MLHLLFTRTKIIAGYEADQAPQLLSFDGQPYLSYQGHSPLKAVDHYFPALVSAYRDIASPPGGQAIPLAIALPADASSAERATVRQQFVQTKSPAFDLLHEDDLVITFLMGLVAEGHIERKGAVVLEAMEQHTNVCFYQPGPLHTGPALLQADQPFPDEQFEHHVLKDFGPVAGNGQVLSDLLKSFTQAGFKVDFKGQTDLAYQLETAQSPYRFQINHETERVTLAGEVRLSDEEYEQLMTSNRERLQPFLRTGNLTQHAVEHVVLLGSYLHQPTVQGYLRHELKLGDKVVKNVPQDEAAIFGLMLLGLSERTAQVRELIRLRQEEEARRLKLEAEIKAKAGREELMERLQATCVDPAKKEDYEAEFVPMAVELGIPEVVIKWNISEALSRVSLEAEALKAGLKAETPAPPKQEPAPVASNGHDRPQGNGQAKQPDPAPKAKPQPEPQPKPEPEPELVGAAAKGSEQPKPQAKPSASPAAKAEPEEEQADDDQPRKKPALSAIFLLNGTLNGEEFPTRKATFKGDSVVKLVRLLPADQQEEEQARKRFETLYEKEKTYYGPLGEISELSEAKEGTYYFRDFIERNTLKEYITRVGLDKKQKVEDLSSEDLKFILQVFKSVQELPVTHAKLSEDNILVLNKRRGLLRRGGQAEIRFTGFTSESATQEQMVNAAHQAFARLMGNKFYNEFRKQFQL